MIIARMVIDMDETRLRRIEQLTEFLRATPEVVFSAHGENEDGDKQRYEHLSRVLKRFDYPRRNRRESGVVLAYLRRTSGYSRAQVTRLVARWTENRLAQHPLAKRYRAPGAPFTRKYTAFDVELLVEMTEYASPVHVFQPDSQRQRQGRQALPPQGCEDTAGVLDGSVRARIGAAEEGRDAEGPAGPG